MRGSSKDIVATCSNNFVRRRAQSIRRSCAVSSHPTAEPEPAKYNVNKGKPSAVIKLKDIDPKAANGELVIGKIWDKANTTLTPPRDNKKLDKRWTILCYDGTFWVSQDPVLYNAKNAVCNYLQSANQVGWGNGATVEWEHWQDQWGNWIRITDANGVQVKSYWTLVSPYSQPWNWNSFFDTFFELIWLYKGNNPDTAGGDLGYYDDGWEGQLYFTSM
ncbi:hypothetical protein H072_6499 [Dactylellina haptotyla CBS 200.50]|uniref:Uncharacterized protein n=1 Tax=Dactylellina haptotyla (strain CBS 200.50) TaxID=1284197 RepID=S8A9W6_DACHA|nr:hypothetical protein H072_6499 [Dactylellina haptotyla CBS 200.50]